MASLPDEEATVGRPASPKRPGLRQQSSLMKSRTRESLSLPLGSTYAGPTRECTPVYKGVNAPIPDAELLGTWRLAVQDPRRRAQFLKLLQKTLVFAGTTVAFRERLIDSVVPVAYAEGSVLFQHGEEGDWMGIVLMGRLQRRLLHARAEIVIGSSGAGDTIGDLGLFGIHPTRSFTVVASSPCTVLILGQQDFEDAIARCGGENSLSLFRDSRKMQNLMADTESFVNLQCFRNLDRDFVLTLRENSEPRLCYPNQVLIKEHNMGDEMYVIRSGAVKVEKDGHFVVALPEGTVIGELAVLGTDKKRTATVTCTSMCLIRALHADVFHEILDRFPRAKRIFETAYVARLVSVHVQSTRDEKAYLDKFFGSATPHTVTALQSMVGPTMRVETSRRMSTAKRERQEREREKLPPLASPRFSTS